MSAEVVITAPPAVLFLDTPQCVAVTEYFTQRKKSTLTGRYQRLGLKVHKIAGQTENGNRQYIVYTEFINFLATISDTEKEED